MKTNRKSSGGSNPDSVQEMLYLPEPLLEFGFKQKMVYPRDGLFLFGPSGNTKDLPVIRYGVIGTSDGVRRFRTWSKQLSSVIPIPVPGPRSKSIEPQHVLFPGFAAAFHSEWPTDPPFVIQDITPEEIQRSLYLSNRHEAVHATVDLFVSRLIKENSRTENPPSFWFVVIPELIYELGRPLSIVKREDRLAGSVTISKKRAQELESAPTLFGEEEKDADVYKYATHFRRQLKARLLKERIVTQIVRETTLTPNEFLRSNGTSVRRVEDPATIAWKLGTGAYYKAGGKPWQLADVRVDVCYVGLVYKVSDLSSDHRHACCAAQMFLTDGEGIVFRGALGPWYHTDTRQFHLDRDAAKHLIAMVTAEYRLQHNAPPKELFIHATSAFTDEEWAGFQDSCDASTNLVAVQIVDLKNDLKAFRPGAYPVIRGSAILIGDRSAYLWTTGYVPRLDTYMGPETPNPISVRVLRGDCPIETVLKDVLGLTKLNFNSCLYNDRLPVTINFANEVGDVLISAPLDGEPRLPFKFYI
jgi:hypothetical protein